MSQREGALVRAEAQVAAVRDDPAARLALMARVFHGPTGRAPRHLPFRRAALSFMRWQARRGVLDPLDASPPGSTWWRSVNERLLRDGCETVALLGGLAGEPSSQAVRLWLEFGARPTGRNWYRAHNASIVGGYLEHRGLAEADSAPERFFMNVALVRVLYAHALVSAPRLALGRLAPLGHLADPRLGMTGVFVSLRRVLPDRYPLDRDVERYIAEEQRLGRMLDYAVIVPRLQRLYEWSADEVAEPRLLELVRDGNPIYAWPFEERHVWRSRQMPFAARVLTRVTRPYRVEFTERKDASEVLEIDVADSGGLRVLRLTGELDMAGVDRFERLLTADGSPEAGTFVVDLRRLTFIDSSGLRALIMADQRVRDDGGRFVVVRGPDRVNQVLEMTGVSKQIELVDEPPAG